MRIKLAGGVGEHGRNSFLVEGESLSFLVDAGVMEYGYPYPDLEDEEISALGFVLLTHSHNDHSGALPFLRERGFKGPVAASSETLCELPFSPGPSIAIEDFRLLPVRWGRTGHCMGSLWYLIAFEGKRLFFSGDYLESSSSYAVDKARGIDADLAILDSAYGRMDGDAMRREAKKALCSLSQPAVLPVPKYGRGFEVLSCLSPAEDIYADSHFLSELERALSDNYWIIPSFKETLREYRVRPLPPSLPERGYIFLSDPQLRRKDYLSLAGKASSVLLTGTVKKGSGSEELLSTGKARQSIFPVHSTDSERERLEAENRFGIVVPNHTAEHGYPEKEIFLH